MNALNHIIQKVVLEIDTNSMKVANSLKNNSSAFIQNELLPLIEKELNGLYVKENESIQIEKISIVVDANVSRVDFSFSSEVKNEVQKQLQKKVQEAMATAEIKSENTEIESNAVVSITGKKSNSLLYFLNHGRLPWWNSKSNTINFNEENLFEIVNDADFRLQFHSIISKKEVQKRLLNQFNDTQIALFLSSQKLKVNQNTIALISTNKIIKQLSTESVQFKKGFWTALFNYVSTNEEGSIFSFYDKNLQSWSLSFSEFIRELSLFIPVSNALLTTTSEEKLTSTIKETLSSISENQSSSEAEKSVIENSNNQSQTTANNDVENNIEKKILSEKPSPTVPENSIETQQKSAIENSESVGQNEQKNEASSFENNTNFKENTSVNDTKTDSVSEIESKDKNSESNEENYSNSELLKKGVYVENAGLILLHPFLKMLFQNCNLLDEKNHVNNKELAVHILHYAATKQEHDYEYCMLFEKFLCGLPLEFPIKREVNIEDYQKNHVEELLTAVVGHWSALKNSSTDILRTEFLQREGKLDLLDANPKLTIEKKTQDILLDKIPWNISIVKIPWMEKIMYTEW
jgi:Contractile injection system tape measure protein